MTMSKTIESATAMLLVPDQSLRNHNVKEKEVRHFVSPATFPVVSRRRSICGSSNLPSLDDKDSRWNPNLKVGSRRSSICGSSNLPSQQDRESRWNPNPKSSEYPPSFRGTTNPSSSRIGMRKPPIPLSGKPVLPIRSTTDISCQEMRIPSKTRKLTPNQPKKRSSSLPNPNRRDKSPTGRGESDAPKMSSVPKVKRETGSISVTNSDVKNGVPRSATRRSSMPPMFRETMTATDDAGQSNLFGQESFTGTLPLSGGRKKRSTPKMDSQSTNDISPRSSWSPKMKPRKSALRKRVGAVANPTKNPIWRMDWTTTESNRSLSSVSTFTAGGDESSTIASSGMESPGNSFHLLLSDNPTPAPPPLPVPTGSSERRWTATSSPTGQRKAAIVGLAKPMRDNLSLKSITPTQPLLTSKTGHKVKGAPTLAESTTKETVRPGGLARSEHQRSGAKKATKRESQKCPESPVLGSRHDSLNPSDTSTSKPRTSKPSKGKKPSTKKSPKQVRKKKVSVRKQEPKISELSTKLGLQLVQPVSL